MKCEICHKADAQLAITRATNGGREEELYVCRECAASERKRRQQKSQRTRKVTVIEASGDEIPPFLSALTDALGGVISSIEKDIAQAQRDEKAKSAELPTLPMARIDRAYRFCGGLHLEGLHLIGELEATERAMRALGFELVPIEADGIKSAGHVYQLRHPGSVEQAKRVVGDIMREEHNARARLSTEMQRVFGDAICRALAILKNCRLLSPGELFDLLSPLRLAAIDGVLDGISYREIESMAAKIDLSSAEDSLSPVERDRLDAERADRMNERFLNVFTNLEGEAQS